jgi:hypothetical protein
MRRFFVAPLRDSKSESIPSKLLRETTKNQGYSMEPWLRSYSLAIGKFKVGELAFAILPGRSIYSLGAGLIEKS